MSIFDIIGLRGSLAILSSLPAILPAWQSLMSKRLVILFIIKLYAQNYIFKLVRKNHGQNILKVVGEYEKLQSQLLKEQAGIKFIKPCESERLLLTFASIKLQPRKKYLRKTSVSM